MFLGLKRLEYRGYDSAGLGVDDTSGSQTLLIKTLGKVALLQVILP
jgi:glucosamine--fructose-6-phosphate aminotransferase (isomerizing)